MAASLDGCIARTDGRVDWLETADHFAGGDVMTPELVGAFLKSIDCYFFSGDSGMVGLCYEVKGHQAGRPQPDPLVAADERGKANTNGARHARADADRGLARLAVRTETRRDADAARHHPGVDARLSVVVPGWQGRARSHGLEPEHRLRTPDDHLRRWTDPGVLLRDIDVAVLEAAMRDGIERPGT